MSRPRAEVISALSKVGWGTLAGLVLALVSGKIIALIAGPSGIGLLSLLRQVRQTAYSLSTLSGQTAVVQGAAARQRRDRLAYLATVVLVFLGATGVVSGALIILAPVIARNVLIDGTRDAIRVVQWLAVPVAFGSITFFTNGVLMARRAMGRLAVVQLVGGVALLAASYPTAVAVAEGHSIALVILMTIFTGATLATSVIVGWRVAWLSLVVKAVRRGYADAASLRYFLRIAGILVVTATAGTGTLLAVRSLITAAGGLDAAGALDAAWTMAVSMPILVLAAFQGYYLPLLSELTDDAAKFRTIRTFLRLAIAVALPLLTFGITVKPFGVELLYSEAFTDALPLMRWMLPGLYFRIIAWVFTVPILAAARMRLWLVFELTSNAGLLLTALVVGDGPLEGIGVGYAVVWTIGALFGIVFVRLRYPAATLWRGLAASGIGLLVVVGASWDTWHDLHVRWLGAFGWTALAAGVAWVIHHWVDGERAQPEAPMRAHVASAS